MSLVDEARKLLQDLIAPELRALQVQVSSLEKTMDARFAAMDEKMEARFAAVDARFSSINARFAALSEKMDAQKESLQADNRVLSATLTSSLTLINRTLQDIDARLRRMEMDRERLGPGGTPAGSAPPAAA